jgi:hypothetical protein
MAQANGLQCVEHQVRSASEVYLSQQPRLRFGLVWAHAQSGQSNTFG